MSETPSAEDGARCPCGCGAPADVTAAADRGIARYAAVDPAGQIADEAYVAGYQDGVTQALRWAATEWPQDGMTRAEAQAWLEQQAARLLCAGHQVASPTRQPCAACVQAATETEVRR